ncbi:MAG: methylated-DNA--[protein]-cysteine S-methyltransferase [Ketobacter sp. GenoA1]|nr:MAG: methylated-DNA--[protein]-cysteine S-methyltransferase [Ketobacter sp. GenoA1]RLT94624.1 MAG: methylated-DNA--[protein]-cysteine S-methyltransferase [Ketobacter sp.]
MRMQHSQHYQRIASAIRFFTERKAQQPSLAELAQHLELSEFHVQRLFSEWVGVSPKQFLKFLTKQEAKRRLLQTNVLESALDVGLSGSSRLHDLLLSCEGVTPGQVRQLGAGLNIVYGRIDTPFGEALLALTGKGICKLGFCDDDGAFEQLLLELHQEWPRATISQDQDQGQVSAVGGRVFASCLGTLRGQSVKSAAQLPRLGLLMKGSPFQLKVWEALLAIPEGQIRTYQQVADAIEEPTAVRAVASAIARNPIGYLIPCHRVIRSTGEFSQYRWGPTRKQAMIGWEACRH